MAERRPEAYAARLIPWLERDGQCSVMKLTDTFFYLNFPPESRLNALNGSFTLEFGEQGRIYLCYKAALGPELPLGPSLMNLINQANKVGLGDVTLYLSDNNRLHCFAFMKMNTWSAHSAKCTAEEILQRATAIFHRTEWLASRKYIVRTAGLQKKENFFRKQDEPVDESLPAPEFDESQEEGEGDSQELYALLAWACMRGLTDLTQERCRRLYDLLGKSVLRYEEMFNPIADGLRMMLPDAEPWGELPELDGDMAWDPAWGDEAYFLKAAGNPSALSGHELVLANHAVGRRTQLVKLRMEAMPAFGQACRALSEYLAKKEEN